MHCFSKDASYFKKISVLTFALLVVTLIPVDSNNLHAAAGSNLTFEALYGEQCAVCHGTELQGEAIGVPLVGRDLLHGQSLEEIAVSIADGFPDSGMAL